MSKIVSFSLLVLLCGSLTAQDIAKDSITKKFIYHYSVNKEALSSIDRSMLSDHPFGENIARKIYLLQDYYTYVEPPSPTSPGQKTIVVKPNIYNSLLKLNRFYKQQVKKGIITIESASRDLNRFLDIGLSIVSDDTALFEAELRKAKSPDQIISVFSMVELK
jgi:hypothetical protein